MNPTLETLHALRTIHGDFSDREVPQQDLDAILQASVRAANASGRQSYCIIVLDDRAMMKDLFGYAGSRTLVYCVDFSRLADLAAHLGYSYDPVAMQDYVTAATDTALAGQTAVIAARSLGIDSLITNATHRCDSEKLCAALNLPARHCVPQFAVVLGYPNKEPAHRKGRLAGEGIIHRGRHQRLTPQQLDVMVAECDGMSLSGTGDWPNAAGEHYLDWFFGTWTGCPKASRGTYAQRRGKIEELLKRAGYL